MTIYKFRGLDNEKKRLNQHTVDMLIKGELFLAKPSTFNDFFDSRIVFKSVLNKTPEEFKDYFKSLSSLYPNNPNFSNEKLDEIADSLSDENKFIAISRQIEMLLRRTGYSSMDFFRIFCFSKKWDIPSMWGYYADNCKGIAIGFNTVEFQNTKCIEAEHYTLNTCPPSIFNSAQTCDKVYVPLYDIKYSDTFPSKPDFIQGDIDSIINWLTTKGFCWAHENEIRMLVCPVWMKLYDPSKVVVYLKQFVINEIIFGVGTPEETKEQVYKIVSDPYSKAFGATINQLVPKSTSYGFDKVRV